MNLGARTARNPVCWIYAFVLLWVAPARLLPGAESRTNAAVLYYQALVQCPDSVEFPHDVTREILKGGGLSDGVRPYVEEHKTVIALVEMGARIRRCDWEIAFPYTSSTAFHKFHDYAAFFSAARGLPV